MEGQKLEGGKTKDKVVVSLSSDFWILQRKAKGQKLESEKTKDKVVILLSFNSQIS